MMLNAENIKLLKRNQSNIEELLPENWRDYNRAVENKNSDGCQQSLFVLSLNLRSRGILKYLLDADRFEFFNCIHQSAMVFHRCNMFITHGMPFDEDSYSASYSGGFFDALLAGGGKASEPVAARMCKERRPHVDHPVFFGFYAFLLGFVLKPDPVREKLLSLLKGLGQDGFEVDIEVSLCEALLSKKDTDFLEAMHQYLDRRLTQIENNESVLAGEQFISIEGLALIRLAGEAGIAVTVEHKLAPADLQRDYPQITDYTPGDLPAFKPEFENPSFWKAWRPVES